MISSVTATGGYAAELGALKGKTFTFPEKGVSILFGPNGCGKTTILKLAGLYSGTTEGWTTFSDQYLRGYNEEKIASFPKRFARGRNVKIQGDVAWDGTPTLYAQPPTLGQEQFEASLEGGAEDFSEYLRRMVNAGSSGEERIAWLRKMEAALAAPPDLLDPKHKWHVVGHGKFTIDMVNSLWSEAIVAFTDYIRSLPRKGPITLLLDEPDSHMSIPNQAQIWTVMIPRLAEKHQIIAATHSPFALATPGANIIDLRAGYAEACRGATMGLAEALKTGRLPDPPPAAEAAPATPKLKTKKRIR